MARTAELILCRSIAYFRLCRRFEDVLAGATPLGLREEPRRFRRNLQPPFDVHRPGRGQGALLPRRFEIRPPVLIHFWRPFDVYVSVCQRERERERDRKPEDIPRKVFKEFGLELNLSVGYINPRHGVPATANEPVSVKGNG